ncbi:hypothetical protein E2C01_032890 [Portunus trituberculatus]|uniref:Uncharacterized protein n=1 Tax=Portunus trituberculatus TaxID=210409 RepID=A0A5B7F0Y5_PORTR|nr:hypothetical protein [Portunus trituberculatus]
MEPGGFDSPVAVMQMREDRFADRCRSTKNDPSAGFITEPSAVYLGASGGGFRSLMDSPISCKCRGPIMFSSTPVSGSIARLLVPL